MGQFIYRLCDAEGEGVYHQGYVHRLPERAYEACYNHPGPMEDRLPDGRILTAVRTDAHLFGFASITQARRWFGKRACRGLAGMGVRLRIYLREDCRDVHVTRKQAIFKPKAAPVIEIDLRHLHNDTASDIEALARVTSAIKKGAAREPSSLAA